MFFFAYSECRCQPIAYAAKPKTFYLRIVAPGVLTLKIIVSGVLTLRTVVPGILTLIIPSALNLRIAVAPGDHKNMSIAQKKRSIQKWLNKKCTVEDMNH